MKKLITFVLIWYVFTNASERTETYVPYLTESDGTVHKCKREDYNEMKELTEDNYTEAQQRNYYRIMYNESVEYTKLKRNTH